MKVLLIEQNGERRLMEDAGAGYDLSIGQRIELAKQNGIEIIDIVDFEPELPLDFYSFDGGGDIIIDEAKKERRELEIGIQRIMYKLDNDYRMNKRVDEEYQEKEWRPIAEERRGWRQELRDLLARQKEVNQ